MTLSSVAGPAPENTVKGLALATDAMVRRPSLLTSAPPLRRRLLPS